MASYEDLDKIVGQLKRACIDAYMVKMGWGIAPRSYYMYFNPGTRGTGVPPITRPAEDGSGGGAYEGYVRSGPGGTGPDYKANFDKIRASIDALVEPWRDLPDPTTIHGQVTALGAVSDRLTLGRVETGSGTPRITGSGVLAQNVQNIALNSTGLAGETFFAFRDKFLRSLPRVVEGHHGICYILTYALAGEEALWERARQDVADAFDKAREAADAAARGDGADWQLMLKVVGWAVAAAAIVATEGAAVPVLATVGLSIDILGTAVPDKTSTGSAGSYSEVLQSLGSTLDDINSVISAAEDTIRTCLIDNYNVVMANKDENFDLSQQAIESMPDDKAGIKLDAALVTEIFQTYLPSARTELADVATAALRCSMNVVRDYRIGSSSQGPAPQWFTLQSLLYQLVQDLATEVDLGAANLKAALAAFQNTDANTRAELDRTEAAIEGDRDGRNPTAPVPQDPDGPR